MKKMTLIGSFDVNSKDIYNQIEKGISHGFSHFEATYFKPKELIIDTNKNDLLKLYSFLKSKNVSIDVIKTGFYNYEMESPQFIESMEKALVNISCLKPRFMVIGLPNGLLLQGDMNLFDSEFISSLEGLIKMSDKHGIKLLFEIKKEKVQIVSLLFSQSKKLSKEMMFVYDSVTLYKNGEALLLTYRHLRDNIVLVKTNNINKAGTPTLILDGEIDYKELIKRLIRDNYHEYISIDTDFNYDYKNDEKTTDSVQKKSVFKNICKSFTNTFSRKKQLQKKEQQRVSKNMEQKGQILNFDTVIDSQVHNITQLFKEQIEL